MINQLFAVAMLVLSAILMVTNFQIDNSLEGAKCDDTQLKNSNKGILVMGTVAVVASLSYLICQARCSEGQSVVIETKCMLVLPCLGIVIVVLASIINLVLTRSTARCQKAYHPNHNFRFRNDCSRRWLSWSICL